MSYIEENSKIWDKRVEKNDKWSVPVSSEIISQARKGTWSIVLTPIKPVPKDWFPDSLAGKKFCVWPAAEDSRDLYWQPWELM